ncbi:MAG TPA: TetR/AcrR family transcriptional regulator [Patescibacteria group bacterium]|nr:TetR/AcrR family transcriptional regulator [Patescibacteria group bacterium]
MDKTFLRRKEKVLITAIEVLDESGVNGMTTKEIARRHGITEPAIYKQYDGKKEIILAILEQFAVFDIMIKDTIVQRDMGGREGILHFARSYLEYYQNYPQIATPLYSFDLYRYDPDTRDLMRRIVQNRQETLMELVERAQAAGEISRVLDQRMLADLLFGAIWSATFIWKLEDGSFDLKDRAIHAVEYLLQCEE